MQAIVMRSINLLYSGAIAKPGGYAGCVYFIENKSLVRVRVIDGHRMGYKAMCI